ncbi:MAG: 6-bladed beta-propeller [Ignavibacteriae bacterium]|nr:6-bladed beta-propeller [Ignavibacteriota bacterium]
MKIKNNFVVTLIFIQLFINSIIYLQNEKKVNYETLLTIGKDVLGDVEYLFNDPKFVLTDKENNIYVAERSELTIRVFDPNGNFLRRIGRRGRGPGEFLDITLMFINSDDEIIVFDNFNAKINFFKINGVFIKQITFKFDDILWPRSIIENNKHYLLGFKLPNINGSFHLFNKNFSKSKIKFPNKIFNESDDKLVDEIMSLAFKNSSVFYNNNTIILAKHFYDGIIYILQEESSGWIVKSRIKGFVGKPFAYERVSSNSNVYNDDGELIYELVTQYEGEKIIANIFNESFGFFKLKNGHILHFTNVLNKGRKYLGFEHYNNKYNLIEYNYLEFKNYDQNKAVFFDKEIVWKDNEDNFYLIDRSKYPKILKIKLKM